MSCIKVVVIDPNADYIREVEELICQQEDIELIGSATSGDKGLKLILENKPDIALINVVIPKMDGFCILEELREREYTSTGCIILSSINHESVIKSAFAKGAKYYLVKPVDDEVLLKRIRNVYQQIVQSDLAPEPKPLAAKKVEKNFDKIITMFLTEINILPHRYGHVYLHVAIKKCLECEEAIAGITKNLYPEIAKECQAEPVNVERSIRSAIETAWKRNPEKLEQLGFTSKPSNSEFIAVLAQRIRYDSIRTA